MIHINEKKNLVPTPFAKKMCKGFDIYHLQ
jgi:hypothetical protein